MWVAMGQLEIPPHPLSGEGLLQGTSQGLGGTGNGSEGWVSWEDPDWIHPSLFIARGGKQAAAGPLPITTP